MKVYLAKGIYYEMQADAKKADKGFETVEFPFAASPKSDFVEWLNNGSWPRASVEADARDRDDDWDAIQRLDLPETARQPQPQTAADLQRAKDFSVENVRRISVEEEIQSCDLPRLATLASNVAWRFNELAKER